MAYSEPEKIQSIDSEFLSGKRYPYQEDISLVEDVDLDAATPGDDINWLEDIELLSEDGTPAVFDRYSNSFIKIYFAIPAGPRERDRAQGADHPPPVRQLVRHPAEGEALQVPAAGARAVGRRLEDRRYRLEAPGARGLGSSAALNVLVLQHVACEPPGVFEDVLVERGATIHRVELDEGEQLPDWHGTT